MDARIGIGAALAPFLHERRVPNRAAAARLEEELVAFLERRGFPTDETAGRRIAVAPIAALDPALAWAFVADHLITRAGESVAVLQRIARLLAVGVRRAAAGGALPADRADAVARAAIRASAELPRLDRVAQLLRDRLAEGRPGRALYDRDPEAYARAMQRWEAQLPLAREVREGYFAVEAIDAGVVTLRHLRSGESIEIELPEVALRHLRPGDRLDLQLGRGAGGWFVRDAFSATAPAAPSP